MKTKEAKEIICTELSGNKKLNSPQVIELMVGFVDMRNQIKKPMTELAVKLFCKRLDKLSESQHDAADMLENAIINNWLNIYKRENDSYSSPKATSGV